MQRRAAVGRVDGLAAAPGLAVDRARRPPRRPARRRWRSGRGSRRRRAPGTSPGRGPSSPAGSTVKNGSAVSSRSGRRGSATASLGLGQHLGRELGRHVQLGADRVEDGVQHRPVARRRRLRARSLAQPVDPSRRACRSPYATTRDRAPRDGAPRLCPCSSCCPRRRPRRSRTRGRPADPARLSFPELAPTARRAVARELAAVSARPDAPRPCWGSAPTSPPRSPATPGSHPAPRSPPREVYTGVLYDALDLASLDAAARRRANRWLVVVSALYGALRPA